MPALKGKRERFCQEYTVDYNQTKAAIRAGYAEKSAAKQGCLLMKDSEVLARIREIQKELAERLMLTRELIVIRLLEVVDICMAAKPVMVWSTEKHAWVESGTYQIDAKGATRALEALGRYLGMFSENKADPDDNGPVFYTGEDDIKE